MHSSSMTRRDEIPFNFLCPITQDIMINPVLLVEDGYSYERSALEKWLETRHTSPLTNQELINRTFVINYNLKSAIEDFCRERSETEWKLNLRSFTLHRRCPNQNEWKHYPKLKIILSLLGPPNVGKSCLAANIEYPQISSTPQKTVTLGVDIFFFYLSVLFEDRYVILVQLNDCPGNDRFESVSDRHFRNCHGAVLMADTTDMETFERLEGYWYRRLREKCTFDQVQTVLACNKIDLLDQHHDAPHREQFFKRADAFASRYQIPIFNISAARGDNVHAMFHHLVVSILENPSLVKHLKDNQMDGEGKNPVELATIKLNVSPTIAKKRVKPNCC